jgi:heme/copper-type cytochrome/quinol oxidase subunit 3
MSSFALSFLMTFLMISSSSIRTWALHHGKKLQRQELELQVPFGSKTALT